MTEKFAVTPWNSRWHHNFSCVSLLVSTRCAHGDGNEPTSTPRFHPWSCTIHASLIAFCRQGNKDSEKMQDIPVAGARISRSRGRRDIPRAWYGIFCSSPFRPSWQVSHTPWPQGLPPAPESNSYHGEGKDTRATPDNSNWAAPRPLESLLSQREPQF